MAMVPQTLRHRFTLLLALFFLLVTISAGVTLAGLRTQRNDALIINLAGRQRMLTQQMTWMALNRPQEPALEQNMARFEETLHALKDGGQIQDAFGRPVTLPPAPDQELHNLLDQVWESWNTFESSLLRIRSLPPESEEYSQLSQSIQTNAQTILAQLDDVVSAFEARAQSKVSRLWVVQAVFLLVGISLLVFGTLFVRRRVVVPLEQLGQAARRIGAGDLESVVPRLWDDELGELAGVMEAMRRELAASRSHLQHRVDQRTNELVEAFEFSQEIVSRLDLDSLLQSVTDRCRKLMNAREARLCLIQQNGRALELVAGQGGPHPTMPVFQPVERGIALEVVGEGKTVVRQHCTDCAHMSGHEPGVCVAAPLKTGETVLGALCVVRPENTPFSVEEVQALTLLANTAAIAITNARLVDQEREQARQSAILTERQRLAAELHDHLAQTLSFLRLKTEQIAALVHPQGETVAEELLHIQTTLDTAYDQVRDAIEGIAPARMAAENLRDSLAKCLDEFKSLASVPVAFRFEPPGPVFLPQVVETQVLHIVRESLANVQRHARASQVTVRIHRDNGELTIEIGDDGQGFDPHQDISPNHLGLNIMRTRAERIGARLDIQTRPGQGTKVTLRLPEYEEQP